MTREPINQTNPISLTQETMRNSISMHLGIPSENIGEDDNLINLGLDSITIMLLANNWKRNGVIIKFADLIAQPTLANWWILVSGQTAPKSDTTQEIIKIDENAPFELAPMQQAYWIGANETQLSSNVNAHYYIEFNGKNINGSQLERAVKELFKRHDMLRARFLPNGYQQIMQKTSWNGISIHDLQDFTEVQQKQRLATIRHKLSHRRMNIQNGEVFDIQLSLLPNNKCRVHMNIEMIVCDARSLQIILEDLAHFYKNIDQPKLPINYSFQKYLTEKINKKTKGFDEAKNYWLSRLHKLPDRPFLPLAIQPSNLQKQTVGRRFHWIKPDQYYLFTQRCQDNNLTKPSVLVTAFAEVIGAWSENQSFLFNMPIFNRDSSHQDIDSIVGDFTNLLITDINVSANISFKSQAELLQTKLAENISYSEYSGLEVLREITRIRSTDWMPAPVVFTSTIGMGDLYGQNIRNCIGNPGWGTSQTPQVWLDCQVTERDEGLLINWDVVEELFPKEVIDAMFDAYILIIEWLILYSDWTNLPALQPIKQLEVRRKINLVGSPFSNQLLHSRFFEWAVSDPNRIALIGCEGTKISYGALAQQALSISAALTKKGVKAGQTVAITMPRGTNQIVATLGILAIGAVYVPVSIDQPFERREKIYKNAQVEAVLTDATEANNLEWPTTIKPITIEETRSYPPLLGPLPVNPDQLAYVIYTSGSTGEPKGVEMNHKAVMNTIEDINQRFGITANDRLLGISALEFDLSVYDIFGMLSAGASIVVVGDNIKSEARKWVELIDKWNVTLWNSVPALLDMLLIAGKSSPHYLKLRLALISGDWIGLDLPKRLEAQCDNCRFIALGGATEAAIWSNFFIVEKVDETWQSIPYGYPLHNQKFRIVDSRGRDCPDWVAGELWIGGMGLSQGYRGDPKLTEERFVTLDGERWYLTGDRGRYWPDGTIEFLGRIDHQIKMMGYRIELGEIESALLSHSNINQAIAIIDTEHNKLYAVVVYCDPALQSDESSFKSSISTKLPLYMIPEHIKAVDKLPLTENGKVNRKVLFDLFTNINVADKIDGPPISETEKELSAIWVKLLDIKHDISRTEHFFSIGGNSILATQMLESIRRHFGVDILLRQLFSQPTIYGLSLLIDQSKQEFEEGEI